MRYRDRLQAWPRIAHVLGFSGIILSREDIAVPPLGDHASDKQPREGTVGQVLGAPGGLPNLPRREPVRMLVEQGHNRAPALLHIRPCLRAVERRRGGRTSLILLSPVLAPSRVCLA